MKHPSILDERLLLLFDSAPICCKLWNRNLEVIMCNQECVRTFGTNSKQEFCERFFAFSPEFQPDGRRSDQIASEELAKGFESGYNRFEWMHQKRDGTLLPAEVTLVKLTYGGEDALAGYIRDMTEQKKMEEVLEVALNDAKSASAAKSTFLAKMSHEMRTPLNVIIGLTDLHMEEMENTHSEMNKDMRKINTAGNTLLGIVNDVLDISKIEAGKLDLSPVEYSTASLLNDIITLNKIRIESKPIDFVVDIDKNLPHDLFGDDLRLSQVFNNLLSNAFKYTQQGSVSLIVSGDIDEGDVWLNVTVKDTGIGIKPYDVSKLFDEYHQADTLTNRKIEGTGLGLPITQRLVTLMGGEIKVESEYEKGSAFHVRLKQGYVNDKILGSEIVQGLKTFSFDDNKKHVSSKIVRDDMSYARVLVVDDFQTNLDVASGLLRKYKLQVDCVLSGKAALERVANGGYIYDAIFMDHMMPEMDGIETTKRIRKLGTEYAETVPIISLTANAIAGNEEMFLENGFQAFLSKPIDILKLDATLKQWVRNKSKEIPSNVSTNIINSGALEAYEEHSTESNLAQIIGIDTLTVMTLYGDDEDLYASILESYVNNTPNLINMLRHVDESNLADYAINVHGLKGSSGNIGAKRVQEKAAKMEKTAKAANLTEVLSENEALLSETETLIKEIKTWLCDRNSKNEKPSALSFDSSLLDELYICCKEFDMNGADSVMEKLTEFTYDNNNELIVWLSEKVATSEFDEIIERIALYRGDSK